MDLPKIKFSERYASYLQPMLLLVVDYVAILAAEQCAIHLRYLIITSLGFDLGHFRLTPFLFYLVLPAIFIVFLHWGRTYIRLLSIGEMFRKTFNTIVTAIVVSIIVLFLISKAAIVSRLFIALLGACVFVFVCSGRLIMRSILNHYNALLEPTILIGSDKTAQKVLRYTANNIFFGIRVIGVIDDVPNGKAFDSTYPYLGPTSQAQEIIKKTGVQNILILAPKMSPEKICALVDMIFPLVKNVSYVPDTEEMPVSNMEMHRLYSENIVVMTVNNNLTRWYNILTKRVFDTVLAFFGTLLVSPFLLLIAILIKLESPGPVFYTHLRIGHNGKTFKCIKFRSMVKDADKKLNKYLKANPSAQKEWNTTFKLKKDPRVTRVGKFLRRTSLDELPQLFNVLMGQMSLVGPRPITKPEVKKYGRYFVDYKLASPGMTGLWQVSGRSNTSYGNRVRLDAWYIRNWNLWLDIGILIRTIKVLLSKRPGAY
ncbi:MAG: sugar transferase [Burkholderiales bacterium]|nr:sugar transferase [Burkholderiales bacterium]